MSVSYWRLYYHLVWATKGREPLIDAERERVLLRSIQATCTKYRVRCHALGFMPDHVHLAVSIPPKVAVSDFMAAVKGSSTYLLNHQPASMEHRTFGWQGEYGVLSFSERSLASVTAYVRGQIEHHSKGALYPGLERIDRREAPDEPEPSLGEAP